jgi:hypothetical protein
MLLALSACIVLAGTAQAIRDDSADVIVEWNALLQSNIPSTAGVLTPRYYAMLHVAMFDAVNSIDTRYDEYRKRVWAPAAASAEAAAAQAGHDVLVSLIPSAQATFDAALQARLAAIHPVRAQLGAHVGRKAAEEVIAWRANDGSTNPAPPYVLPALPGLWQPTPPNFQPPQFPQFAAVEPFALLTATQYLPTPPPTLISNEYTEDFEEVKQLGSAASTQRSADQTLLARLFAPSGYRTQHWAVWNNLARDTARRHQWSLVETARLFALMNVSIHDGVQTAHTSKFIYGLWRPVTAIRGAGDDLNDATVADPVWSSLITTPPYPSHASNQACVGASAARALARAFGSDSMQFDVTWSGTPPNADVTRQYTRFWALADEQARSRVYAGIHYTFELTASQISCVQVADYVFEHYMRPRHRQH